MGGSDGAAPAAGAAGRGRAQLAPAQPSHRMKQRPLAACMFPLLMPSKAARQGFCEGREGPPWRYMRGCLPANCGASEEHKHYGSCQRPQAASVCHCNPPEGDAVQIPPTTIANSLPATLCIHCRPFNGCADGGNAAGEAVRMAEDTAVRAAPAGQRQPWAALALWRFFERFAVFCVHLL